jgi:MFS family permease
VPPTPLRRNRDFVLLQIGQALSNTGTQVTLIAYPLLVLAVTDSAAKAGIVSFARALPMALLAIPAGLAADRWNRKHLMIVADAIGMCAAAALGGAVLTHRSPFWLIPVLAFVGGAASALFSAGQSGAVRAVVPLEQLPAAVGTATGRQAAVSLVGPSLGGALFGVARAVPFLFDAVSYAFSTLSLLAMRAPFQQQREPDPASIRSRVTEGFRFLWDHPYLRVTTLLFGLANFIAPGLLLTLVVVARQQGLSGGAVGALVAAFGAALLVGSLVSPYVRRALPVRGVMTLELWMWPACVVFLVEPSPYVLLAGLVAPALAVPSTDSVVHGYRIAMTPDRLLGRSESVRSTIALLIAPLGPLLAGALLEVSARLTVAVFACCAVVLALWGTASRGLATAPDLDDLVAGVDARS